MEEMKKLVKLLVLGLAVSLASCYDDSALWDFVKDHETRIAKLETLCSQMNTNITSLQAIVDALQDNDYVTEVAPVTQEGKVIGYTISFAKSAPITIYHGKDGKDGEDGKDGADGKDGEDGKDGADGENGVAGEGGTGSSVPQIGIRKDSDGLYYWTLNGEWLRGEDGGKICAVGRDGFTPKLKIEEDKWYVSYDNGKTWEFVGDAVSNGSDAPSGAPSGDGGFFSDVKINENSVVLVLADGTEIIVPKKFQVNFTLAEVKVTTAVFTGKGKPVSPDYEVGIYYSTDSNVQVQKSEHVSCVDFQEDGSFEIKLLKLKSNTTYYYRSYVSMYGDIEYSEVQSFTTPEGAMTKLVKTITLRTTDLDGEWSGWNLNYVYDDEGNPVELTMEDFGYDDEWEHDKFTFRITKETVGSKTVSMIEHYYHNELESRSELVFDDYGRVCAAISASEGEYGNGFTVEYDSDGKMTKVRMPDDDDMFSEVRFNYSNGYLYNLEDYWSGEDSSDIMLFDELGYIPGRIPASALNVDINMFQIFYLPEVPILALIHLGYCGNGFTADYLYEQLNPEVFGSDLITEHYYGTTMDPDYESTGHGYEYRERENENTGKLRYGFDADGAPLEYYGIVDSYEKYEVEYRYVAGEVVGEWIDMEWDDAVGDYVEVVRKEYQIVREDINETFVEDVDEYFEGFIQYYTE
jgi:hypothetical protein